VLLDRVRNVQTDSLWQLKTICVMLVGVAIKLALYNPAASATALHAEEQRLLLGMALGTLFFIQMAHTVVVDFHNYAHGAWIKQQPGHLAVVVARITLTGAHFGTSFIELQPYVFLPLQASFCVVQTLLIHWMMKTFAMDVYVQHPLHGLPHILNAMRVQRKIASVKDKEDAGERDDAFKDYLPGGENGDAAPRTAPEEAESPLGQVKV